MKTERMKKQIHHEGYNYVLEYNNSLIMYKEDTDEWMGDIEQPHLSGPIWKLVHD